MAAAFHGDLDTIRHLLSLGAKASLVDAGGRSAAVFAGMRGHRECFAELQRVADEEEKEQRARSTKRRGSAGGGRVGGGSAGDSGLDFVYDLYFFEPSAPTSRTEGAPASGGGGAAAAVPTASGRVGKMVSLSVLDMCSDFLGANKRFGTFCFSSTAAVRRSTMKLVWL